MKRRAKLVGVALIKAVEQVFTTASTVEWLWLTMSSLRQTGTLVGSILNGNRRTQRPNQSACCET